MNYGLFQHLGITAAGAKNMHKQSKNTLEAFEHELIVLQRHIIN